MLGEGPLTIQEKQEDITMAEKLGIAASLIADIYGKVCPNPVKVVQSSTDKRTVVTVTFDDKDVGIGLGSKWSTFTSVKKLALMANYKAGEKKQLTVDIGNDTSKK